MLQAGTLAALPESLRRPLVGFADEYLADGVPFGGRDAELTALDAWLADPELPCALVVAEAGRGKSALLARWSQRVGAQVAVVFVPVSIRFGTASQMATLRLLAAQLQRLAGTTDELPRDTDAARAQISALLAASPTSGPPWLVVLDGVDEAVGWALHRALRLPAAPGLKILVSARALAGCDLAGWRERLGWTAEKTQSVALSALDARCVADVLRGMGDPLAALGDRAEIARMLARVTEGDPLVLRLYVDALRAQGRAVDFLAPGDLAHAPPGIDGYMARWWAEQRTIWAGAAAGIERDAHELLCALASALGPLMRDDLDALIPEHHPADREVALRALGRLVIGDGRGQGYVFSHPRLAYYVADRMSAADGAAWERRFVGYGEAVRARLAGGAPASVYVLRHHGAHLERSGAGFRELSRLVAPAWQAAWEALEGSFEGFLGDVERASTRAEAAVLEDSDDVAEAAVALYRCALVRASIRSLAANAPAPLLVGLVEAGMWSPQVALAYAGGGEPAIAAIAHLLSDPDVRAALERLDSPGRHYLRVPAFLTLLGHLLDRGAADEVMPALARQTPDVRAEVLLRLAPRLPAPLRVLACDEIRAHAATIGTSLNERTRRLLELAGHVPAADRAALIATALAAEDFHLGPGPEEILLLARAGALSDALALARREPAGYPRARALAFALAGADPERAASVFREWEAVERALWSQGNTVLHTVWPMPRSLPLPVVAAFRALVREIPFPGARALCLARLALVYGIAAGDAVVAVQALAEPDRLFGFAALADGLDGEARSAAIAHVLAGVRARDWAVPSEAWDRADRRWHVPAGDEIEWSQYAPRSAAELLATVGRLLPGEQRAEVLREALARSRRIEDAAPRGRALAAMTARLADPARGEVLAQALAAAHAAPVRNERARALSDLLFANPADLPPLVPRSGIPHPPTAWSERLGSAGSADLLPRVPRSAIPDRSSLAAEVLETVDLEDPKGRSNAFEIAVTAAATLPAADRHPVLRRLMTTWAAHRREHGSRGILAILAPHLPADLLELAWRDGDENERWTLAACGAWPEEQQIAVAAAVLRDAQPTFGKSVFTLRDQVPAFVALVPKLPLSLIREALGMVARIDGQGEDGYWRAKLVRPVLVRLAEHGLGGAALGRIQTLRDPHERATVLCGVIPHLAPALRDAAVMEVLGHVRGVPPVETEHGPDYSRAVQLFEASAGLVPLGHGGELVAAARRVWPRGEARWVSMKLIGCMTVAERGPALAGVLDDTLAMPADRLPLMLGLLVDYAGELPRRGFAELVCRALRELGRYRREVMLVGNHYEPRSISRVPAALDALGGAAAVIGAARACAEVGAWFP